MENKSGRNREGNFSPSEVESLVEIATTHKDILENKCTNAVTWKRKAEIWDVIATAFNALTDRQPRTAKSLRLKYESLKKDVRKASAQKRKDWEDTGGGPYKPTMWPPIYEKLYANIKMSCDGMNSPFDCDNIAPTSSPGTSRTTLSNVGETIESHILEELVDEPDPEEMCLQNESIIVDFADYSAPMLQTRKPKELKYSGKTAYKIATVKDGSNTPTFSGNIKVIKVKERSSKDSVANDECNASFIQGSIGESSNETLSAEIPPCPSNKRKLYPKKKTVASVGPKYESLCDVKSQLAEKELLLVTNRIEYEKIEHEKRMESLVLTNEKLKLENKKLKLELGDNSY